MQWHVRASRLRDAMGLKNKDIGEMIDESEANVSRYLKGTLRPDSITVASKFAKVFGVSLEYMVFGEEDHAPRYPPAVQKVIDNLVGILEGGHETAMDAIIKNIETFKVTVTQAKEIADLKSAVAELQKEIVEAKNADSSPDAIARPILMSLPGSGKKAVGGDT